MPKDELMNQLRGKKLEKNIKSKEPTTKDMEAVFKGGKLPKKMRV